MHVDMTVRVRGRNVDSSCETVREIESLLASKAVDDDRLRAGDLVLDLSSHLDVFHAVLKQVHYAVCHSLRGQ